MAIMREIRSTSNLSQPNWIVREDLNNLIPLLFLGQIDQSNEKDRSILQTILGNESVIDYFKKILIWQKIDDSPIMFYGTIIKVSAVAELWNELSNQFTIDDFKNLIRLIEQIFSEDISKINIGTMNSIFKSYEYYSEYIYDGLLSSLILFSIKDNSKQYQIDKIIEKILNMIKNVDQLKYISKYFGLLSEASPERFIDFLEKKFSSQKELIIDFLTPKKNTFIFSDNQYTNLLHSLTTLTELKKYNIKVCNFLVQLYLLNLKYSLTNSPENSLITILSFLNKENAFTFQEKISFLLHLIDQYKENVFELCIKVITEDAITLSSSSLRWRNSDISDYKLTYQEIDSAMSKIIERILNNLNGKDTEVYCKILGHCMELPEESMYKLKKYAEKNFQTDEEKKFVYYYIIHELKNIKPFKKQKKYQKNIDFFEQLLVIVSPEDQFVKNLIYFNDFSLYILEMNNKTIIQLKELFNDMKNKYDNLVEKISTALNDKIVSGYILSEILSFEEINLAFDFLLETQKFNTLISLLEITYNELDTINYLHSISRENLEKIIKLFGINNIVNFNKEILQDNDLLRLYWENRIIFNNSSLEEINQIKKFNSLGYLQYLDRHIDYKLWNIPEILELLMNLTEEDLKKEIHLYYLEDILYKINDNFYNNVVISASFKFYFLCKREKMFKSIRRFLLENPIEFIKIILKSTFGTSVGFNIRWNYYFPDDFEKKPELLENFADVFYNYELDDKNEKKHILSVLGEILARSTKYSSNLFIPNCLRKIIEKYKSVDIRLGFALGHYNAIGVRSLDDGTVDLNLSKKYETKALEIEIEFPETAKIFYDISNQYKRSANERKQEGLVGF
ncbi:hypothetical protein [Spiroplasma attinicola]|uniref:hypothetical protein n=1 Tax=Spiroplasma attinicola TaxID=2904537 RepID=UPI002022A6E8|nr:hypothetical protein [Spiroplasma sp. JKS002670]